MSDGAIHAIADPGPVRTWAGQSIPRVEDATLLTGRGRFIDDLGVRPGTLHAALLRSPHAHADIVGINVEAAKQAPGVVEGITILCCTGFTPALQALHV